MPHPAPSHPPRLARSIRRKRGFSLFEMLVVICLVGILGSAVVGWYVTGPREAAEKFTNQRNAQEIVALSVYALMGGADFVVAGDKNATVQHLVEGTLGTTGAWKGKTFQLTTLDPDALPGALAYVKFESDILLYEPAGAQP